MCVCVCVCCDQQNAKVLHSKHRVHLTHCSSQLLARRHAAQEKRLVAAPQNTNAYTACGWGRCPLAKGTHDPHPLMSLAHVPR